MNRKERWLMYLMAAVIGLAGGTLPVAVLLLHPALVTKLRLHMPAIAPETPQRAADVISAKKFVLVDDKGKTLAALSNEEDLVALNFYAGQDDKQIATFGVLPDGTSIVSLLDSTGKFQASLAASAPMAVLHLGPPGPFNQHNVELSVDNHDSDLLIDGPPASIRFRGPTNIEAELKLTDRGPRLEFSDPCTISTINCKGAVRALLGSGEFENTLTGASWATPLSSLSLFDKNGKVIWQAPRRDTAR
jgi:hypothetical protein